MFVEHSSSVLLRTLAIPKSPNLIWFFAVMKMF
jgi:hypothetical protein